MHHHRLIMSLMILLFMLSSAPASAALGTTIAAIKERGMLRCGTRNDLSGFAELDDRGEWTGLDVAFCQAIAAAIFADPKKVEYLSLAASQRLPALQKGDVDVLIRNTTWTFSRDTSLGLHFVGVNFYDGQGFLGKRNLNTRELTQLPAGTSICVSRNTTTIVNLQDYVKTQKLDFDIKEHHSETETFSAFFSGRCQVLTGDRSALASARALEAPNPDDYVLFDNIISKEPLGLVVRDDDPRWADAVRWILFATIEAEEQGINSTNIDTLQKAENAAVAVFFQATKEHSEMLGLHEEWFYHVIKKVGNYGEIFERNLGEKTPLGLRRGLNALWRDGGLMYSPPLR